MFKWLERKARLYAIRRSLKRKAPSRFSYSSEVNYFVTVLRRKDTDEEILVESLDDTKIGGLAWTDERFQTPIELPISELDEWSVRFTRFYGFLKIDYKGVFDYFRSDFLFYPQRMQAGEWLSQKAYNYRTRFRQDRIEVLRRLVEMHLSEAQENNGLLFTGSKKSVVGLLSDFYGNRIYGHPDYEVESARFRLILESLTETGEIKKHSPHEFQLSAGAVTSISNYELEERRHRDSVRQNWLLFLVTVVMAVAAVVQAVSLVV
jgi:hypothetical protein